MSFDNSEASSSYPNKGTHPLSLFTVNRSSISYSIRPTLITSSYLFSIIYLLSEIFPKEKSQSFLLSFL